MADFDVAAYLASKAGGLSPSVTPINQPSIRQIDAPRITPIAQPLVNGLAAENDGILLASRLMEASQQKQFEISQASRLKQLQLDEANKGSLISRIGLSPDSFAGQVVDAGAQAISGLADVGANVLTVAPSAYTAIAEGTGAMTPEYANRVRQGIKSFEDLFTNTPNSLADTRNQSKLLEGMLSSPETGEALKRVANTTTSSLGVQTVKDLGTLVSSAIESAGDNPAGVVSFLANNIPQIGLAIASAPASAINSAGYALQNYNEWSTGFAAKNNGREPSTEERLKASTQTAGLFLAELFGDAVTAGIAKGGKGVATSAERALKDRLLVAGKSFVAPATGFAKGAAPEAITEGVQTYLEGELTHKPATAEDIYQGAAVGGLLGGTFGGVAGIGKNVADTVAGLDSLKAAYQGKKEEKTKVNNALVAEGNIDSFIKDADATKNDWISAADVLVKNSNLKGKSEKDIAANIERIDTEIVKVLESEIKREKLNTSDKAEIIDRNIALIEADLSADPNNADLLSELEVYKQLAAAPVDPISEGIALANIKKLQRNLDEVIGLREGLAQRQKPVDEAAIVAEASAISQPIDGATEASVNVPDLLIRAGRISKPSNALADSLEAAAKSGKVTESESASLITTANEIRAVNTLEEVQKTVTKGGPGFIGIVNYRNRFKEALNSKDTETATKAVKGLNKLVGLQTSKLDALYNLKPNQAVFPVKNETGITTGYEIKPVASNFIASPDSGVFAYKTSKATARLIRSTESAVDIGNAVLAKMVLDSGVKSTGVTSVKETSQAKQTSQERQKSLGKRKDAGRVEPKKQTTVTVKEVNATTVSNAAVKQAPDKSTTAVDAGKESTASKSSKVSKVTASTESESESQATLDNQVKAIAAADKRLAYLNNPPADYTPAKAKEFLAWADKSILKAKELKATAVGNVLEGWADTINALTLLKSKAESVIEGDVSLASVEGETTQEVSEAELEAIAEEALPELLSELGDMATEKATVADVAYLTNRIDKLAAFLKCMKG